MALATSRSQTMRLFPLGTMIKIFRSPVHKSALGVVSLADYQRQKLLVDPLRLIRRSDLMQRDIHRIRTRLREAWSMVKSVTRAWSNLATRQRNRGIPHAIRRAKQRNDVAALWRLAYQVTGIDPAAYHNTRGNFHLAYDAFYEPDNAWRFPHRASTYQQRMRIQHTTARAERNRQIALGRLRASRNRAAALSRLAARRR